jgi:hypothetical protein
VTSLVLGAIDIPGPNSRATMHPEQSELVATLAPQGQLDFGGGKIGQIGLAPRSFRPGDVDAAIHRVTPRRACSAGMALRLRS